MSASSGFGSPPTHWSLLGRPGPAAVVGAASVAGLTVGAAVVEQPRALLAKYELLMPPLTAASPAAAGCLLASMSAELAAAGWAAAEAVAAVPAVQLPAGPAAELLGPPVLLPGLDAV